MVCRAGWREVQLLCASEHCNFAFDSRRSVLDVRLPKSNNQTGHSLASTITNRSTQKHSRTPSATATEPNRLSVVRSPTMPRQNEPLAPASKSLPFRSNDSTIAIDSSPSQNPVVLRTSFGPRRRTLLSFLPQEHKANKSLPPSCSNMTPTSDWSPSNCQQSRIRRTRMRLNDHATSTPTPVEAHNRSFAIPLATRLVSPSPIVVNKPHAPYPLASVPMVSLRQVTIPINQ